MSEPIGLPILAREEYGFRRTVCSCKLCTDPCEHTPGMLAPADILRIMEFLGYQDVMQFARENLVASQGAVLARITPQGLQPFRVVTIVPARQTNGHCKFLVDGKCTIHPVSPYGCSHFDSHQGKREADRRSLAVHNHIQQQHRLGGPYNRLWQMLKAEGQVGVDPAVTRMNWIQAKKQLPTSHTPKKARNEKK